jgi:hypothetical protein
MNPEIELYSRYLRKRVTDILTAVQPLSEEQLNCAPGVPGGNSPFVIATHTFGNIRAWVLGIVCGQEMGRDRASEFVSRGTYADLQAAADSLCGEIDAALDALDPATLDDSFTPKQELFGEGVTYEQSRREALLHPVEHASIHLGHILLTVDMLRAGR